MKTPAEVISTGSLYRVTKKNAMEIQQAVVHHKLC